MSPQNHSCTPGRVTHSNHTASLELTAFPQSCDLKPPFLGAPNILTAQGSVGFRARGSDAWHQHAVQVLRGCSSLVFQVLAHQTSKSRLWGQWSGQTFTSHLAGPSHVFSRLAGSAWQWGRVSAPDGTQGEQRSYLLVMSCSPKGLCSLQSLWWGPQSWPLRHVRCCWPVHGAQWGRQSSHIHDGIYPRKDRNFLAGPHLGVLQSKLG